jgi:hypothetical protein
MDLVCPKEKVWGAAPAWPSLDIRVIGRRTQDIIISVSHQESVTKNHKRVLFNYIPLQYIS